MHLLVDSEGKPNFKYVVEGANLFFTQQARLFLEKKGVVLFKDSSTNKVCCDASHSTAHRTQWRRKWERR